MDEDAAAVDLIDAASNRLEHLRSMSLNLGDRLEDLLGHGRLGRSVVGEANALHDLAAETQELLEALARRERQMPQSNEFDSATREA